MKRTVIALAIISLFHTGIAAQNSTTDLGSNETEFVRGKELYMQKHYAISKKWFETYLLNPQSGIEQRQEAEYYIALNAYHLKDKNAIQLLKDYLITYPYTPMTDNVNYMIGRLYYEKKNYENAIKHYNAVNDRNLTTHDIYDYLFSRGYSYLAVKDYKNASKNFDASRDYNSPHRVDAEYYYAYSEFCQNHYKPALEGFLNTEPSSRYYEASQYHALQIYDQLKQYSKAVELGKKLVATYPSSQYNSEAYRILGENSYYRQNWSDVTTFLHRYAEMSEKVQRSDMYMLGIAYYMTEAYQQSVPALAKVTSEKDSLAQNSYVFIGHAYLAMGDPAKARMAFQSASLMEIDPKLQEEALYNYALSTYESNAPFGEMIKAFEKFIADYPNSKHREEIYEHLADVYLSDKNYEGAIASMSKLTTLSPKLEQAKEQALFQLGIEAFNMKNYNRAIEQFTKSLSVYSDKSFSSQAYLWLGEAYYRTGDMVKARENLRAFLSTKQGKTFDQLQKAYYTLGYSHFEQKEYDAAQAYFDTFSKIEGIERSPLYADVMNRTGDYHFNKRDFNNALTAYDRVPLNAPGADYALFQKGFIQGIQKQYDTKIKTLSVLTSKYPHSDYHDDAMYETGRTYVLMEQYDNAIESYRKLIKHHAKSALARKAALEIGMIYWNTKQNDKAIQAYKYVINKYPTSEETRVALESLEALYIDNNKVDEYIDYRETIAGTTISTVAKSQEDSISFLAAEKVFAKGEYTEAITSLNSYIVKFCETPTLNCITAKYYLAEALYHTEEYDRALAYYDNLSFMEGNSYMEPALLRASEITYKQKDFNAAKHYFAQLHAAANSKTNRDIARLGLLRCSHTTGDHATTISIASEIIENVDSENEVIKEARYCRAKAYIAQNHSDSAVTDLMTLGRDISSSQGAEAQFLYAEYLFLNNQYDKSESEIMNFIEQGTPHQYWLAHCFILLSDINAAKGDDFMAKQYLLSLQENYQADDDIQQMIDERLNQITMRETEQILQ